MLRSAAPSLCLWLVKRASLPLLATVLPLLLPELCLVHSQRLAQAVLEQTNAATFSEVAAYVAAQHAATPGLASAAGARFAGRQRLPAALTVAGGVTSADHARTFPALAQLLRGQARPER